MRTTPRTCWRAAWSWRRVFASRARTTPWCCTGRTSGRRRSREVDQLLEDEPANPGLRNLKAAVLGRVGEYDASIALYRAVLRDYPRQPKVWMSLGHALKTANHNAEAIEAYRRCIELAPEFGEVWWSLANLKTFRFTPHEIATMRAQLARADLTNDDRFHFHFSLGKALEDAGDYAASFDHYAQGNALRRKLIRYDADDNAAHVERSKRLFTREFFAARAGVGLPRRADPIFIVGLPRSGSTLVEQILASHSQVEGTQELPDITMIARAVANRTSRDAGTRLSARAGEVFGRGAARAGRALPDADPHPAQDGRGRSSSTRCLTTSRTSG